MSRLRPSLLVPLLTAAGLLGSGLARASAPTLAVSAEIAATCADAQTGDAYSDLLPIRLHFFDLSSEYRHLLAGYYDGYDLLQVGPYADLDLQLGEDAWLLEDASLTRMLYYRPGAPETEAEGSISGSFRFGGNNTVYVTVLREGGPLLGGEDILPLAGDATVYLTTRMFEFANEAGDACQSLDDVQAAGVVFGADADSDGDGVSQGGDLCPTRSAGGEDADGNGCRDSEQDFDRDGVKDPFDRCLSGSDLVDRDADGIPDACDAADLETGPALLTVTGALPALCTYGDGSTQEEDVDVRLELVYDGGSTYNYSDYGANGAIAQTAFWSGDLSARIGAQILPLAEAAGGWGYYYEPSYTAWYHHYDNYYYNSSSLNLQYAVEDEAGGAHYGSLYIAGDGLFADPRDTLAPGDWTLGSFLGVSGAVQNEAGARCELAFYGYGAADGPFSVAVAPLVLDADDDGVDDEHDACPGRDDLDDADGDGVAAGCDVCPEDFYNDSDGDGSCDGDDPCPLDAGDDLDQDGACGDVDPCPLDPDDDLDQDGVCGDIDACPQDEANDADGDGLCESADSCPSTPNADQLDNDGDRVGNACEPDNDGDGRIDDADNCPLAANADQADGDRDGAGDACDADDDGDGVADVGDACAATPVGAPALASGCSLAQAYPCGGSWKNHGAYVSAVSGGASALLAAGRITDGERGAIVAAAGASSCGKK